jgi:2-hydroxychromene-2-carboxylate isomerase
MGAEYGAGMADAELFFDPICPWAWITSRWVAEVARLRDLEVTWRFICLRMVNADKDYGKDFPAGYPVFHGRGQEALRIAAAARDSGGNEAVAAWYTAIGTKIHVERGRDALRDERDAVFAAALEAAGLPGGLTAAADDPSFDAVLQAETDEALARTGKDVGTPIITFGDPADGHSFFGPVISKAPKGDEALRLWDAVATIAAHDGFAELKRSIRSRADFT